MKRKERLPELLAPAGSTEALFAAVEAGADAVYLGGKSFGARAYAQNFDRDDLVRAVKYCHLHGVKVYVTVNILFYDKELAEGLAFCADLYAIGVDAVIVADRGLVSLLRRYVPQLEIHASTQMAIHSLAGAESAVDAGATRVVPARELSLDDIKTLVEKSRAEIEIFLHGALCVCHSGQCLFSSLVGGRSGNRGECAGPCRLPYNGKDNYPLSLMDLSLSDHITEILGSGVSSLKIEGRMKSPGYVYEVTSVYRKLLDEGRNATKEENARLARAFTRGGFTDGYFTGKLTAPMTGVRSDEDKELSRDTGARTFAPMKKPLRARLTVLRNTPAKLELSLENRTVTVTGDVPEEARSIPLSAGDLTTRVCKMGDTYFTLSPCDVTVTLDDGLFLTPGSVNALRRAAVDALTDEGRTRPELPTLSIQKPAREKSFTTALCYLPETARAVSESGRFDVVFVPLWRYEECADFADGVALPPVVFDTQSEKIAEMLAKCSAKYALVSDYARLSLLPTGMTPVADFRFNITNGEAKRALTAHGVSRILLSAEATLPQARDVGGGLIVYGRVPLMITERCFVRENGGCSLCGKFTLTDRVGKKFPILREYPHRNLIFNAVPTYMGDKQAELDRYGISHRHFIFTVETPAEAKAVLKNYFAGKPLTEEVRRIK